MNLYNSLSKTIETFKPRDHQVSLYVCGITPYDTTHLGHAFTYTTMDILVRYLEFQNFKVNYVQNVTDIDDDILRKAKELGEDWRAVVNQWTTHFINDMQTLNVRPPDHFPRATDMIDDIIGTVQALLSKGVAYEKEGSVYFDINSWSDFGKLSDLPRDQMLPIANERGNRPDDPKKRNPLDFVLWQTQTPGEPAWESPWGPGRPGWHIECSTMATRLLGETVDIHSGGLDLCFPHHECEIAQVEPITGRKPFVRFWMHIAMVRYAGEKMSKSLGNLIMVSDLLKQYSPDAIRLYLGSHHYRNAWEFQEEGLREAKDQAQKLTQALLVKGDSGKPIDLVGYQEAFCDAMDNDLDSSKAIQVLLDLGDKVQEGAQIGLDIQEAQQLLQKTGRIFGLRFDDNQPEKRVMEGWNRQVERFGGVKT